MDNKYNKLLANPAKFLNWVESPEAHPFNEFLSDWRVLVLEKLVRERETVELHRLQGELKAIDTIQTLRGIVREYAKGLTIKTMKPVGGADGKSV